MPKYVNADRLAFDLKTGFLPQSMDYTKALMIVEKWLKEAPAADVVEVVRCKDCRFCKNNLCFRKMCAGGPHSIDKVSPNFFCARGKRRDDDATD